jgi:hypothetical protein
MDFATQRNGGGDREKDLLWQCVGTLATNIMYLVINIVKGEVNP